jgi:hypothetical protein
MRRIVTFIVVSALVAGFVALPAPGHDPTAEAVSTPTKIDVAPYFWIDEAGSDFRPGPFLVPVQRKVDYTLGVGKAALEQLIAGPTTAEKNASPAISTQVPKGTKLLNLTIADGTAKVYFNSAFAGDDDSAAAALRVAQVVFTLTRYPTVDRVEFYQDGNRIKVQTASGNLRYKVTRKNYRPFMAAISVETPVYHGITKGTVHVTGEASVFEAAFRYRLEGADGKAIRKGQAMSTNGVGWGDFDFTLHYDVSERQVGKLKVWTYSAKDGSKIDLRVYPVVLKP